MIILQSPWYFKVKNGFDFMSRDRKIVTEFLKKKGGILTINV